jgi:hypothetical protein
MHSKLTLLNLQKLSNITKISVVLVTKPNKNAFYAIDTKVTISCIANTKVIGEITWYKKTGVTATKIEAKKGVVELTNVRIIHSYEMFCSR